MNVAFKIVMNYQGIIKDPKEKHTVSVLTILANQIFYPVGFYI